MLIGNEGRQSNLRVMYGMLASSALAKFDAQRPAKGEIDVRDVYFINLIRMLEMYRYGRFYSPPPNGVLETAPLMENPLAQTDEESESQFVLAAIAKAHASVSKLPREKFVESMEGVFQAVYRRDFQSLDAKRIFEAKAFLTHFVAELRKGIDNA
jgi:hypothetical protein